MPFILIIAGLYLFWPRYDLDVALDPKWNRHEIVATDFYSLDSCIEAANIMARYDYICLKWTPWSDWTNKYTKYDSKHR